MASSVKKRLKAHLANHQGRRKGEDEDDDFEISEKTPELSRKSSRSSNNSIEASSSSHEGVEEPVQRSMSTKSSQQEWREAEKMIYEQQLEQLQDQLESVMIEKEKLANDLRALQSMEAGMWARQLDEERRRTLELSMQVEDLQQRGSRQGAGDSASEASDVDTSWVPVNEQGQTMPSLPPPGQSTVRRRRGQESSDSDTSQPEMVDVRQSSDGEDEAPKPLEQAKLYLISKVVSILADFTVDPVADEHEPEPEELSFNRLKGNWKRFWDDAKPVFGFFKSVDRVLGWDQWTTSLACFLLYMYTVWLGLLVPSLLFVAVCWLSFSWLKATGILLRFAPAPTADPRAESEDSSSTSSNQSRSYWQLVTQVAQKVQNTTGGIADSSEKFVNLLAWHHPDATKKLYMVLWFAFLATCVLPEATVFRIVGLFFGYKMFIERSVYRRFPKVEAKYDTVARIWKQLPTNTQLEAFTALRAHRQQSSQSAASADMGEADTDAFTVTDQQFCDRFGLSPEQRPLEGWKSGVHCRLIDKDRPLTSVAMPGKLYMTAGYLCFERSGHRLRRDSSSEPDLKYQLVDIIDVKKAKAFSRLPGNGMAIEVDIVNLPKPLIFGAILNRHEVLQQIMEGGRKAGLRWGYPPSARPPSS